MCADPGERSNRSTCREAWRQRLSASTMKERLRARTVGDPLQLWQLKPAYRRMFADLQAVDIVANGVRGKTAEDLIGKVKSGGTFASVTGVPANAAKYPKVRTVAIAAPPRSMTLFCGPHSCWLAVVWRWPPHRPQHPSLKLETANDRSLPRNRRIAGWCRVDPAETGYSLAVGVSGLGGE